MPTTLSFFSFKNKSKCADTCYRSYGKHSQHSYALIYACISLNKKRWEPTNAFTNSLGSHYKFSFTHTHTYIHINLKVQATTNFNSRLTVTLNSYSFIIQKQATNQPPTHKQIHVPNSNSIKMWFLLKLNSGRNLDKMS